MNTQMRQAARAFVCLAAVVTTLVAASPLAAAPVRQALSDLPLPFEANRGQAPRAFPFTVRTGHSRIHVRSDELQIATPSGTLRLKFLGARRGAPARGEQPLPGRVNYYFGPRPAQWVRDVPTFRRVRFEEIYPGVDLAVYGNQRRVEFDLIAAPGADPTPIRLSLPGARNVTLNEEGDLVVALRDAAITLAKPHVYQSFPEGERALATGYRLLGKNLVGVTLSAWDRSRPLIIDPTIQSSRYFGGAGDDTVVAAATDRAGNVYFTGLTSSAQLPGSTAGAYPQKPTGTAGYITKLSPDLKDVLYTSYFGGSSGSTLYVENLVVDPAGNAVVVGATTAADFPTTPGAYQRTHNGGLNGYVMRFAPSGSSLVFSTFLQAAANGSCRVLAAAYRDADLMVASYTTTGFPVTPNAYQTAYGGGITDGFLARLSLNGATLLYASYLGALPRTTSRRWTSPPAARSRWAATATQATSSWWAASSRGWSPRRLRAKSRRTPASVWMPSPAFRPFPSPASPSIRWPPREQTGSPPCSGASASPPLPAIPRTLA